METAVSGLSAEGTNSVPAGWVAYVVKPGDTLFRLARERGTTVAEISLVNGIGDPSKIRSGQVLYLPPPSRQAELASRGLEMQPQPGPAQAGPTLAPGLSAARAPIVQVTPEERDLLARLVTAEARNEPIQGQTAVAAVVLNRLRHPAFPKTITAIIMEPGQFKCVETGRIADPPTGSALLAVDRALAGEDPSNGALFFYNPVTTTTPGWWSTRTITATIGNHNFAR